MRRQVTGVAALVVVSFIFGATFVVVKDAIENIPPLSFIGWRFAIGAAVLFLLARPRGLAVWRDGLIAGFFLFAGYALQTEGLARTSAANSGLITGLFVVLTPILGALLARRRIKARAFFGALLAFAGLALVTIAPGFRLQAGDVLTVGCAVAFAAHILALAQVAPRHPVIPLTAVQLLTTAGLSLLVAPLRDGLELPERADLLPIVFTGLVVSAIAFLLQVRAQQVVGAAKTAVILALEPAFALATAAVVVGDRLTDRGWIGAGLILVAIYVVVTMPGDAVPAAEAVTPAH